MEHAFTEKSGFLWKLLSPVQCTYLYSLCKSVHQTKNALTEGKTSQIPQIKAFSGKTVKFYQSYEFFYSLYNFLKMWNIQCTCKRIFFLFIGITLSGVWQNWYVYCVVCRDRLLCVLYWIIIPNLQVLSPLAESSFLPDPSQASPYTPPVCPVNSPFSSLSLPK